MRTPAPIIGLAALMAMALLATGCGSSSDASTTDTTARAAAGIIDSPGAGKGDGPDPSVAPTPARSAAPPVVTETDAQLNDAIVKISTFPTVLDPKLWNGDTMKPDVAKNTVANVESLAKRLKMADLKIDAIELFGSNASYEYDDKADFGVHVFVTSPSMSPATMAPILRLLNNFAEKQQEGRILFYGVPLEVSFHATRGTTYQPKKGQGQYSFTTGEWVEKPTPQPNRFDRAQMLTDARAFIDKYNALVEEYAADKKTFACDRFGALDDEMKKYRGQGLDTGGQRSTGNLTYRMLRRISVNVPDEVDALEEECDYIQQSLP